MVWRLPLRWSDESHDPSHDPPTTAPTTDMSDEPTGTPEESLHADEAKRPAFALVLGGLAGGIAIGAAAGAFLVGPMVARASGYAAGTPATHAEKAEGKKGEEGATKSTIHTVENLVLNPSGTNGTRFLMCSVAIEFSDEKFNEVLTARDAEVRDAILGVLGRKTIDELSDVVVREAIKLEVRTTLDQLFKQKGAVARLYFPQFVIQ